MPHILQVLNQDNPLKNNEKIVQGGGYCQFFITGGNARCLINFNRTDRMATSHRPVFFYNKKKEKEK